MGAPVWFAPSVLSNI